MPPAVFYTQSEAVSRSPPRHLPPVWLHEMISQAPLMQVQLRTSTTSQRESKIVPPIHTSSTDPDTANAVNSFAIRTTAHRRVRFCAVAQKAAVIWMMWSRGFLVSFCQSLSICTFNSVLVVAVFICLLTHWLVFALRCCS